MATDPVVVEEPDVRIEVMVLSYTPVVGEALGALAVPGSPLVVNQVVNLPPQRHDPVPGLDHRPGPTTLGAPPVQVVEGGTRQGLHEPCVAGGGPQVHQGQAHAQLHSGPCHLGRHVHGVQVGHELHRGAQDRRDVLLHRVNVLGCDGPVDPAAHLFPVEDGPHGQDGRQHDEPHPRGRHDGHGEGRRHAHSRQHGQGRCDHHSGHQGGQGRAESRGPQGVSESVGVEEQFPRTPKGLARVPVGIQEGSDHRDSRTDDGEDRLGDLAQHQDAKVAGELHARYDHLGQVDP